MSLRNHFSQLFSQAFLTVLPQSDQATRFGTISLADRPDLAHYQCNGALAASKALKKNPREVATAIQAAVTPLLDAAFGVGSIELSIAGPGFINLKLNDALIARTIDAQKEDPRLGCKKTDHPRKVVVDYGGPNVAKAMHVGHLRSSIIGDSIVRIYRFVGDHVIGDIHIGDWGTQMGMLICEIQAKSPTLPYFDKNFTGPYPKESPVTLAELGELYPAASARYKTDEDYKALVQKATSELQYGRPGYKALWQHFVNTTIIDLTQDFALLGITFDVWLGESFYEELMPKMIEELKQKGITQISEGALTIPIADEQNPEMPPVILVKSGGGYLYHTSDLATIQYRVDELKADLSLYVVDKRQSLHFKQVFKAAEQAQFGKKIELRHTPFGTMNGTDGKPFKTRSGGVLKLKDLIQMVTDEARKRLAEIEVDRGYSAQELESIAHKVGIATLRFADLKHNRVVDYVFDLDKFSRFEGHTGPYLLYATVRIKSILRKAAEQSLKPGKVLAPTHPTERTLMLELLKLPDMIANAYNECEPHHLCDYGFNLSQAFNSFYKECHILRETDPARQASWLALCKIVHDQLSLVLDLLGISVPERM